ncbi:MAG: hypothetical protein ACSLFL_13495 [Alphaproteobacteria bacterium]
MSNNGTCPIWGTPATIEPTTGDYEIVDSPRAGGRYSVSGSALGETRWGTMNNATKARLTTWLIDQRERDPTQPPNITSYTIDEIKRSQPLHVYERADRLIKYLARKSPVIGSPVTLTFSNLGENHSNFSLERFLKDRIDSECLAWSESQSADLARPELIFLLQYLVDQGWITQTKVSPSIEHIITLQGHARLAELATQHVNSAQGFVAMWFDDSMIEAYEKGIGPGIEDAGYSPLPINRKEHINKIDDEIIAEIRRSRFVVADFTHGDTGPRGGVYYEAGFALGLGIPVFFTCRKDILDKIHFDTRQYNHILWETHAELRKALADKISAVIGDGPNKTPKAK